jgi:hypothetical protein
MTGGIAWFRPASGTMGEWANDGTVSGSDDPQAGRKYGLRACKLVTIVSSYK